MEPYSTSGNAIESSEINVNDNRSIGYILTIRDEKTPKTNVEISFWISCRLDKKGLHSVPWAPAPPIGSKILLKIGKRCKIQLLAPPGALLVKLFRDIPSCYTFRSISSKLLFRSRMYGQAVLMVMVLFTSSLIVLFSMFVAKISFDRNICPAGCWARKCRGCRGQSGLTTASSLVSLKKPGEKEFATIELSKGTKIVKHLPG